jgi:hypothetical protein
LKELLYFVIEACIFDIIEKPVMENRGKSGEKFEHYGKNLATFLTIFHLFTGNSNGKR